MALLLAPSVAVAVSMLVVGTSFGIGTLLQVQVPLAAVPLVKEQPTLLTLTEETPAPASAAETVTVVEVVLTQEPLDGEAMETVGAAVSRLTVMVLLVALLVTASVAVATRLLAPSLLSGTVQLGLQETPFTVTVETPEPVPSEAEVVTLTEAFLVQVPLVGEVMETDGAIVSRLTVIEVLVLLPATSVAVAVSVLLPSLPSETVQLGLQATLFTVTEARPEPTSAAETVTLVDVFLVQELLPGEVKETVGGILSTTVRFTVAVLEVNPSSMT